MFELLWWGSKTKNSSKSGETSAVFRQLRAEARRIALLCGRTLQALVSVAWHVDAEKTERVDEDVEKVKVQAESPIDCQPERPAFLSVALLDPLHVEGVDEEKQDDDAHAKEHIEECVLDEQPGDEQHQRTDQSLHDEAVKGQQIAIGEIAVRSAPGEHGGRNDEHHRDTGCRVLMQYRSERNAVQESEYNEHRDRQGGVHALRVSGPSDEDHHQELSGSSGPPPPGSAKLALKLTIVIPDFGQGHEGIQEQLAALDQVARDGSGPETRRHDQVDPDEDLIQLRRTILTNSSVQIGHVSLLFQTNYAQIGHYLNLYKKI